MKKVIGLVAVAALLFSADMNAQEKVAKKEKAKTEKSCSSKEKKSCSSEAKACCSSKKAKTRKDKARKED